MNPEREKVKQTVAKLLNLTIDRGASESEAMRAAEKAKELMTHYDIELSELALRSTRAVPKMSVFKKYASHRLGLQNVTYIARLCDCMCWCDAIVITFFGLPHDAEIAAHLFDSISNCVAAEIDAYKTSDAFAAAKRADSAFNPRMIITDFIDGMEERISTRLQELDRDKVQTVQEATGRSLVPLKMAHIKEDFTATGIKLRSRPTYKRWTVSSAAHASGNAAGERVSLSPGVTSATARRLK